MTGQKISHYQILEKLGSGGMGAVYKAKDLKLGRFVAIKFLNKELHANSESRQRFINEAKTLSSLDHPNIAEVHEIGEFDDGLFICMKFYEGQSLQEILSNGPLSLEDVHSFGIQIAQGLSEAHKSGVIHRDIKPGNIIVTNKGPVKILDFGLSKGTNLTELTRQDTILGTAAYMSPEQIEGKRLDQRTDIFSFGIMLYEMITGERPFGGDYSAAVSYSIMHEDPPPLSEKRPETPDMLEKVVLKALAKDEHERYQSAEEIEADLKAMQDGSGGTSGTEKPRSRTQPNRKRIFLGAGLAAIALLVSLFFILTPGTRNEPEASIAVMPFEFEGEGDWNWLGGAITELINTDLAQNPSLRILGAEQRRRIMECLGIKGASLSSEENLKIARKANAKNLLLGSLRKVGDRIQVQARLLDSEQGDLLADLEPIETDHSKLYDAADNLSSQLIKLLGIGTESDANVGELTTSSLDAYRYFIEGKSAALDRRYQESIPKLQKAIGFDSTFVQPYYWLAWQYSSTGDDTKAKQILAKGKPYVAQLSEVERLEYLCEEAKYDDRYEDYVTYLEQLMRRDPFDSSVHFRYGWTQFYKFRRLDAGIRSMEKSVALDSTYSWAYNILGYVYLAVDKKKKALEMADKYIALNPTNVNPLDTKAEIQLYIGQYDEAAANCERILAQKPDFLSALKILARTLMAQGKFSQALEVINRDIRMAPTSFFKSEGLMWKAEVFLQKGEFKEALNNVEQALEMNRNHLPAHWVHSRIWSALGDKKALKDGIDSVERVLQDWSVLDGRWFLYHLKGELAQHEEHFGEAVQWFKKAIDLGVYDRPFYLVAVAVAYEKSGQFDKAIQYYNSALAFNPNYAAAAFGMARTYENLKDFIKARQSYRKFLEIWAGADEQLEKIQFAKRKISTLN